MAEPGSFSHTRISRETRRLLLAALMAFVVLWLLARVRSTDDARPQGPVQPILDQLAPGPTFSGLASEVSRVLDRLQPSLLVVSTSAVADDAIGTGPVDSLRSLGAGPQNVAALRVTSTLAIALLRLAADERIPDLDIVASDAASGLRLLNVQAAEVAPLADAWRPQRPEDARYLWATTTSASRVSLRPVFVASLEPITRPAWSGQIWRTASPADLEPGSFVFTTAGDLAGLVIDDSGDRAIVGPDVLKVAIDRLRDSPDRGRAQLGLAVQPLTRRLAAATGATGGVVVSWVDPEGPSAGALHVGDVIEEADGERLTYQQWAVRSARLVPGEAITVRARRGGDVQEIGVVAAAPRPQSGVAALGLTLRALPGVGSEVVRVTPLTAAHRAGLEAGDVITLAGAITAPTPGQIRDAFAADPEGQGMLVAVTRGTSHRVLVVGP
jgi:hypothetical protein